MKSDNNPESFFDELTYLESNPDVESAVLTGLFASGYDHWIKAGRNEGRSSTRPPRPANAPDEWNECSYLRANPDVAAAVRAGAFPSGYEHWIAYGMEESRPAGLIGHSKADPIEVIKTVSLGFNCFGYGSSPTGLGSAMRGYMDAFRTLTHNVRQTSVPLWGAEPRPKPTFDPNRIPYAFNIILQNPDVLPLFLYHYSRQTLKNRINIGSWVWELHAGYPVWRQLSQLFHEIWVPSRYVAESLYSVSAAPLVVVPYPVDSLPTAPAITRAGLGLPENAFTFLYIFDLASTIGRKNPIGILRAFRNAFRKNSDVCLVLKYHNIASDPVGAATLERFASACPNVRIFNETMTPDHVYSLMQIADCFVSPHRSEGFGFNMAASMYYAKPVIATGYSGNMDYMDDKTAFLIDYNLVPVGGGHPHYRENYGWAEPLPEHMEALLMRVYQNRDLAARIGVAGQKSVRVQLSVEAVAQQVRSRLQKITNGTLPGDFS